MQKTDGLKRSRAYAEIRIDAILHNFNAVARLLPPSVKIMAVVKANAYGHGALQVAKALEERADSFAVACLQEARQLREGGIRKPILILAPVPPDSYEEAVRSDLSVTVFDPDQAALLGRAARFSGKTVKVHLAVDTGMGRIGVSPDERGLCIAERIAKTDGVELEGVFSHFACADGEDLSSAREQERKFGDFLDALAERGIRPPVRHLCNSAGSLRMEKKYDLCRLGIVLYGYAPDENMTCPVALERAMTVKSRVMHVKEVEKGTPVSYGHTYVAPSRRRIATLGIGYGDGYDRCISGKGYVLLHGKRAPVVGRICMDQTMVDVTDIPETQVGDSAVILGKSGEEEITADLLGSWANSFSYEVLCTFLPRVERIYE